MNEVLPFPMSAHGPTWSVGAIRAQARSTDMFRTCFPDSTLMLILAAGLFAFPASGSAQTETDLAAIEQAALDYIQGYYSGNPERMERALHPDLAKRIVRNPPSGGDAELEQMDAATLIDIARSMGQRPVPEEQWVDDVTILDVYENVASVRVDAAQWIDYLHLARWNGEWKIVNVLWEMHPSG